MRQDLPENRTTRPRALGGGEPASGDRAPVRPYAVSGRLEEPSVFRFTPPQSAFPLPGAKQAKMKPVLALVTTVLLTPLATLPAAESIPAGNWYERSFLLLHLDHHTNNRMEVGRDADPVETARLINLVRPDVIQIHAKGNPGWTTYPTKIGHTPPKLARDVMQVWTDIAKGNGYVFSAYYNIGRDREIMKRQPAWNRVRADGTPFDNMLCYHSGVAEHYLWPMIDEIMDRYRPQGFWFDGSCFTVNNCYCAKCRERFCQQQQREAPENPQQPGWNEYKEMQRQIYREFCAQTAARIKHHDPACLVAINWAYAWRIPEEPPPGVDYFTGDTGCEWDQIAPAAIWYDSQGGPFDLMPTVYYNDSQGAHPKPRLQVEQELGIIIAHGGRYFAWDNPTPGSALVEERFEMMARVVSPFLRSRQPWCLGSRALPDIALFHGAASHYAQNASSPAAFPGKNPTLLAACEGLRRLHLSPEMISDRRLECGDIRGRLLLLEDDVGLTEANRRALHRYVANGGRLLLTGKAVDSARLVPVADAPASELSRHRIGRGEVFCLLNPLFSAAEHKAATTLAEGILQEILPKSDRHLKTDAPDTIELALRERDEVKILHAVNIAPGRRERDPKASQLTSLHLTDLPGAPACHVSVRVVRRPATITLQPQNQGVKAWTWHDGKVEFELPAFETHQMVVIQYPSAP